MDKFEKQPSEEFTIAGNFTNNMIDGETIASQSVTAILKSDDSDQSDIVLDQLTVVNDGAHKVFVMVRAGDTGNAYQITFKCITTNDHRWELDIEMKVKEV